MKRPNRSEVQRVLKMNEASLTDAKWALLNEKDLDDDIKQMHVELIADYETTVACLQLVLDLSE